MITKAESRFVAVELSGTYSRGMTCTKLSRERLAAILNELKGIDWYNHLKKKPNVRMVLQIEHARYQSMLEGMFTK